MIIPPFAVACSSEHIVIRTEEETAQSDNQAAMIRHLFVSSPFFSHLSYFGIALFHLVIDNHLDECEKHKDNPLVLGKANGNSVVITCYANIKNHNILYIARKLQKEFDMAIFQVSYCSRKSPVPVVLTEDEIVDSNIPTLHPRIFTIRFEKQTPLSKL